MENILRHATGELLDVKKRDFDLQSVVNNLSEAIWSIDLTTEPYKIVYHNNPIERLGKESEFYDLPSTMEEWQSRVHEEDKEWVLEEVVNALSSGYTTYSYRALRKKMYTNISEIASAFIRKIKSRSA